MLKRASGAGLALAGLIVVVILSAIVSSWTH